MRAAGDDIPLPLVPVHRLLEGTARVVAAARGLEDQPFRLEPVALPADVVRCLVDRDGLVRQAERLSEVAAIGRRSSRTWCDTHDEYRRPPTS